MDIRPTLSHRRRDLALRILLPAIIVLAALVVHALVVRDGERREREHVAAVAGQVADELQRRVGTYGNLLYGVRGVFVASEHVTPREFHEGLASEDMVRRYPGVKVVGYADLLAKRGAAARVAQVRRETRASRLAYGRFAVHPATGRKQVAPITYTEPQRGNAPAFGLDLLSEPRRRAALRRTLRTGRPEATASVRLIQETGRDRGFLVMLAVPRRDGKPAGSAYAAFRMSELVKGAVPASDRRARIKLSDLGPVDGRRSAAERTYDSDPRGGRPRFGAQTIAFDVMGRRWGLAYAPDHSLESAQQSLLDWLTLLVGGVLALLAAWLLRLSSRTKRRAVALAERMTESLRGSQTELARSNAELERFAYIASHDLREPLRTVTGFLGLLSRRYRDRLDNDGREFVELAVQGAKRMDELIAELLEYSRAGRRETVSEPTDLEVAWGVAVRNLSAAIVEADAEVTSGPLPVVMGDRGEMVQVLQNLLGNAIKYRSAGAAHIHAAAVRRGDEWEVSVSDDGAGIDPRHHDRIFVLLQRLHRQDEVEGTGMGLAICKKIVEHHGGRIWVESEEGEGARFTFALQAATTARDAIERGAPPVPTSA